MKNLEKYIRDHHDEFDSMEPDQGHFDRFEDRLTDRSVLKIAGHNRPLILKIAALIIILISVSVFIFDFATREIREQFTDQFRQAELPLEIRQAFQYYDNQTITQIATIRKLASSHDEAGAIRASTLKNIQNLDASTEELRRSFTENPGNEQILDAIIRNQQMKESMLNTIINQLSQLKN